MSDQDPGDSRRRRLEGVIPEILKRAVEIGVEKATEAPDTVKHFMQELKLPKEIAGYLLAQVDDTKNDILRVVGKEVRDFLEHTNLAGEMQKLLTTLQFEINTTIRFSPNDGPHESKDAKDGKARGDEKEGDARTSRTSVPPPGTGLPKPEVKSEVYVKRDDRSRERKRGRE